MNDMPIQKLVSHFANKYKEMASNIELNIFELNFEVEKLSTSSH